MCNITAYIIIMCNNKLSIENTFKPLFEFTSILLRQCVYLSVCLCSQTISNSLSNNLWLFLIFHVIKNSWGFRIPLCMWSAVINGLSNSLQFSPASDLPEEPPVAKKKKPFNGNATTWTIKMCVWVPRSGVQFGSVHPHLNDGFCSAGQGDVTLRLMRQRWSCRRREEEMCQCLC